MQNWTVGLTVALWTVGTLWLVYLVLTDKMKPALPPWIIFFTTMILGMISFWLSPKHTVVSGIGFIAGVGSTLLGFVAVLYKTITEERGVSFNKFQKSMLGVSAVIVLVWVIMKFVIGGATASFVANVLTQLLMTVGYVAMAERLWKATSRVESLFFWSMIFLGSGLSLVGPIIEDNVLGIVYGIRAVVTSGITVLLLLRIELRSRALTPSGASA